MKDYNVSGLEKCALFDVRSVSFFNMLTFFSSVCSMIVSYLYVSAMFFFELLSSCVKWRNVVRIGAEENDREEKTACTVIVALKETVEVVDLDTVHNNVGH